MEVVELHGPRAVVCNVSDLLVRGTQHKTVEGEKTAQFELPIKMSWSNTKFCFWLSWIDFGFLFASLKRGKP